MAWTEKTLSNCNQLFILQLSHGGSVALFDPVAR